MMKVSQPSDARGSPYNKAKGDKYYFPIEVTV